MGLPNEGERKEHSTQEDKDMTRRKYNAVERLAECSKYGCTFGACLKTLEEHADLDKLTARQIAQILDAMYASSQYGYAAGLSA